MQYRCWCHHLSCRSAVKNILTAKRLDNMGMQQLMQEGLHEFMPGRTEDEEEQEEKEEDGDGENGEGKEKKERQEQFRP